MYALYSDETELFLSEEPYEHSVYFDVIQSVS